MKGTCKQYARRDKISAAEAKGGIKMLFVLLAIVLFAVGADQLTKILFYGDRSVCGPDADFIKGFVRFHSVENKGVAWGFLSNNEGSALIIITVFTVIVTALMIYIVIKYRKSMTPLLKIASAMVVGGAIGNLIDRIWLGYVRDFICTEFIDFPVFNVADCFVTCGGILLGVILLFTKSGHRFMNTLFPDKKSVKTNEPPEAE